MRWEPSAEQRSYQEAFRGWLADIAPSGTLRGWLDTGDPREFERRFAADGWAGVGLPEDDGGQGGGLTELALTAEELGRSAAPSASWMATVLATPALTGRPDLISAALAGRPVAPLLPADQIPGLPRTPATAPAGPTQRDVAATGAVTGAAGPTQRDVAAAGTVTGVPLAMNAAGAVTGSVPMVLAGDRAERFVVLAGEGDRCGFRLIEAASPGVRVTSRRLLDRTRSVADVSVDHVSSEPLPADPETALHQIRIRAGVLTAADSLGAAGQMLDLAVTYSKQRHQFGAPIGSFQAVKHAAAIMLVGIEAARSVVYYAAAIIETDPDEAAPPPLLAAAAAKSQVTSEGSAAADSALTLHGAVGYTWEHDLQLFYKRAKLNECLYGRPAAWNDLIADSLALA